MNLRPIKRTKTSSIVFNYFQKAFMALLFSVINLIIALIYLKLLIAFQKY